MALRDLLLPEFDQEMANTRKMLEHIHDNRFDFQPHPKSWKLDRLVGHVADLPGWITHTIGVETLDLKPGDYTPFEPKARQELLDKFDGLVKEARAAIAGASDEDLYKIWTMRWDGKQVMSMPRISVLRTVILNHLIHHRAQVGVYLRLMNEKVPGMYGPSTDEPQFGMTEEAA